VTSASDGHDTVPLPPLPLALPLAPLVPLLAPLVPPAPGSRGAMQAWWLIGWGGVGAPPLSIVKLPDWPDVTPPGELPPAVGAPPVALEPAVALGSSRYSVRPLQAFASSSPSELALAASSRRAVSCRRNPNQSADMRRRYSDLDVQTLSGHVQARERRKEHRELAAKSRT
jgi:hypothetical protein